ncbi:glycosyltransferase family 2 protein [Inquilinus sp. KBS0705]|nr:glycosyltransferase family 2 protein [Inquilinus sp. KBS0705]
MVLTNSYKVYVVIVVYNGMQWLQRCLSSLQNSLLPLKVILVDNGSVDGSPQFIKTNFSEYTYIQADTNLGFGRANNIGIEIAINECADYVFLLNQDAWVEVNTIQNLINIHKKNPQFGILSPMHLDAGYLNLDYNFSTFITPDKCPNLCSDIYTNNLKIVYAAEFINAAAWLMSAKCIKKVGLFDKLFFHYGEDRNYSQRVLYHGFKIGVCPSEKIVHDRDNRKGPEGRAPKEKRQRKILVRLCDINDANIKAKIRSVQNNLLRKTIKNALLFRKTLFFESLSDYLFVKEKKKSIIDSWYNNSMPFMERA